MADNKDLIYERFREKVYDDFTEFKEYMLGSCPKEQVYKLAEEITFREALAFFILTGTYLEENMSAENCKILTARFGKRILRTLYTYWNESDFFSLGCDELFTMANAFCERLIAEKHYYDFIKIDRCFTEGYEKALSSIFLYEKEINNARTLED